MPYYKALSDQMECRIKKWITQIRSQGKTENIDHSEFMREIHLTDSRTCLNDYVIRMGTGAKDSGEKKRVKNEMEKYNAMVHRIKQSPNSLFLVIIDEAHFGVNVTSEFASFFNQPNFDETYKNVITVQVSATPYTMMTKYTRIPESNVINWLSDGEEEGNYYGVKSYYENITATPKMSKSLSGHIVVDSEYESMVSSSSKDKFHQRTEDLSEFVRSKLKERDYEINMSVSELVENAIQNSIRLACTASQYMQSMLKLKGYSQDQLTTIFEGGHFTHWKNLTTLSESIFKIITGSAKAEEQEAFPDKGKMCLLRVKQQYEAKFLNGVLRKLRKILGLESVFAIVLDIDDENSSCGIKRFNKEETPFRKKLQQWKHDPYFCAERYEDLLGKIIFMI